MTPHELVGRTVRVLAWDGLRDVLPTEPRGIILRAADLGGGDVEVTVRVVGLTRCYAFGLDEVEVLPRPADPPSAAGRGRA
jgi:hypothetical protein